MKKNFNLSPQTITQNIARLQKYLAENGLDGCYVSSFDQYLNEYVPLSDCHRYYFTGFTGSTAEALVPREGKARVYVDGRYHEQVDLEVPADAVLAVKPAGGLGNAQAVLQDIRTLGLKTVGYEAPRTSLGFLKQLEEVCETKPVSAEEMHKVVEFAAMPAPAAVDFIPREFRGRDTLEKLSQVLQRDDQGMFVAALDGIAWVTNCRSYQMPHMSSFRSKALLTRKKIYVFIDPATPLSAPAQNTEGVEWIKTTHMSADLVHLQNVLHLSEVTFDPAMLNCADFGTLLTVFGPDRLVEKRGGLVEWMSIKEPAEIRSMEESFKRSDKAIFETIQWVKQGLKAGKRITEFDLWSETRKKYETQGAREQSFNTIAGVGPNGSIIHYGSPSDEIVIKDSDMVLLDSGGYYEGGFATDCTRTFFASSDGAADPEYKKIYTLVLKGLLACQSAVFPEGTKGNVLDGLARAPMMKHGYNYNHGTGHGVGIHVHEDGVRISPISQLPMKPGQVVSIEPGIYVSGFAGVRLENVAVVEKHPKFKGFLQFRSLVFVGFDRNLVDESLLNSEEKAQWLAYEALCAQRGTAFKQ
jgi:Xaa-Pro aminopeptidase